MKWSTPRIFNEPDSKEPRAVLQFQFDFWPGRSNTARQVRPVLQFQFDLWPGRSDPLSKVQFLIPSLLNLEVVPEIKSVRVWDCSPVPFRVREFTSCTRKDYQWLQLSVPAGSKVTKVSHIQVRDFHSSNI